jgi:hypothetical protein
MLGFEGTDAVKDVTELKQNEVRGRNPMMSLQEPASFFEHPQPQHHATEESDFAYCEDQLASFLFLDAKVKKRNNKDTHEDREEEDSSDAVASFARKFIRTLRWILSLCYYVTSTCLLEFSSRSHSILFISVVNQRN